MHRKLLLVLVCGLLSLPALRAVTAPRRFPAGVDRVYMPPTPGVRARVLRRIGAVVVAGIAKGEYPGAVVLVGHRGKVIYRGVFGNRRIVPNVAPMRFNTIFDLASLTKVIATTPSVMQLYERGQLRLDAPVTHYWPAFGKNGKEAVTIRELLTHTSGLPPDIPSPAFLDQTGQSPADFPGVPAGMNAAAPWHGQSGAAKVVEEIELTQAPGAKFVYSDVNFLTLGLLVRRLSGERLDVYARRHVFQPLRMKDTMFNPPASLRDRIAPTQVIDGKLLWGVVHDPTARTMNGVSGLAGLFSTASDLARYAQCLLDDGRIPHPLPGGPRYLLSPLTVLKMTSPQTPLGMTEIRGLGWDLDSSFSNRGTLLPIGSFGHTGFTGTSIWIDPATQTYIIVLTSRVHPQPQPGPGIVQVRDKVANIVAASLTDVKIQHLSNTGRGERARAYPAP